MKIAAQKTGDDKVDRAFGAVIRALRELDDEGLSERPIVEWTIGTSDTAVPHGLGYTPRGRIIVYQSADARIWDGPALADSSQFVNLRASASVTVRLIFF